MVPLYVDIVDQARRPVASAVVSVNGEARGTTDRFGRIRTNLMGPEGRVVRVGVQCPPVLVAEGGTSRDLVVRVLRFVAKSGPVPLHAHFRCVSPTRKSVLLVRADGQSDLPVRALGQQVAITDENGIAAVILKGVPGDEVEVLLDTSAHPHLRPAMPARRLVLPAERRIFVFDQAFEMKRGKRKSRNRRTVRGPRRI